MGRSHTLEAIVLQTHNVGEADRFCILFTRERGKLAARARGVRKLQSKMGGTLLPMQHIHVDIVEGSAGMLITSVHRIGKETNADLKSFSQTQQGIEMLISILEDDHPLEEIFDLTLKFLEACDNGHDKPLLPFSIRLLHLLGVLPDRKSDIFRVLSDEEFIYI